MARRFFRLAIARGLERLFGALVMESEPVKASPELYRCWIELEFLKKEKVIASAASPELTGTHDSGQPLHRRQ